MELLLINTVQVARCHVGDTSSRGMAWHGMMVLMAWHESQSC